MKARSLRHRRDHVDGVNAPLHTHGVGPRRNLYLRSWEGEADCVRSLLAEAVDLETFAARCLPAEDLRFCSDCLREVTVNRCEALRTLILDAPYLMNLRVDHCFNLDTIEFLHPSSTGGPLKVSSRGAYLDGTARRNLRAHPRLSLIHI